MPLSAGCSLCFDALIHYKSLFDWHLFFKGKEVADIISKVRILTLFQPIIKVDSESIYGNEALSRGIRKDGSIMNPNDLFSTAKNLDLLFNLDRICRETAIRSAAKQGIKQKVFINFIPTAIYEPALCLKSTADVLHEVNINALIQLSPDYMKIDAGIIRNIHQDGKNQALLDEYIMNGRKMGLMILAEGVETKEEYAYLKAKGIDLVPGYLFGKPSEIPIR